MSSCIEQIDNVLPRDIISPVITGGEVVKKKGFICTKRTIAIDTVLCIN